MEGTSWQGADSDERCCEALEAEIRELAAHLAAGSCRIIELIGEFDRREGYAWHGLSSTAQWLSWQCGTSLHTAREQVRVARALAGLPRVHAVFREGGLSFSKVRAISRVATPDNEELLVETARFATAAQLERLLSACRRAGLGLEQMQRHARRCLRWQEDEDGMLRLHARLPAEEGALVIRALEAAADRIVEEKRDSVLAESSGYRNGFCAEAAAQRFALDPDDVPAGTWAGWLAENPHERRYADALCRLWPRAIWPAAPARSAGPSAI